MFIVDFKSRAILHVATSPSKQSIASQGVSCDLLAAAENLYTCLHAYLNLYTLLVFILSIVFALCVSFRFVLSCAVSSSIFLF